MRKKISSDTFQKFLTRSAYLVFPSEISHLLPIQSSKSEYIYSEFKIDAPPIWGRRTFDISFGLCWKSYFCLCFGIIQLPIFNLSLLAVGCQAQAPTPIFFPHKKSLWLKKNCLVSFLLQTELLTIHCSPLCFCARGFCGHCVEGRQLY